MGLKADLRPDGRSNVYQATGTLKVNGKSVRVRESLHTTDPHEAYLLCRELEVNILLGKRVISTRTNTGDITFTDLIHRFLADPSTGSGRTAAQCLMKFDDTFGSMLVREFNKADATQYVFENHTSLGHSNNHTRRVITQLQSLLNYGYEQGFRQERITLRKPPEDIKEIETLQDDEIEAIFKKLPSTCRRVAQFILNTGARPNEAYSLRKRDVDFPRKKVTLTSIKGRSRIPRKRIIPLNPLAYAAAHGNQAASLDQQGDYIFTYKVDGEHRPFYTEAGKSYFAHKWLDACRRANVEGKSPYCLRHTFGTRLGEKNIPFATISTLMGHTDPKTTMRYVHPTFEDHITAVTSIL